MNVPGCPVQPDNMTETVLYLLYQAAGFSPIIPLDDQLRPTWLFGKTVHEGCDRAGYYEQGDFAHEYGSSKCLVKIGCWGPVANCNVTKRGWMRGIGGCPNVGGICIACTMPGFPDKFMPFMDEPPGATSFRGGLQLTAESFEPFVPSPIIRPIRSLSGATPAENDHRISALDLLRKGTLNGNNTEPFASQQEKRRNLVEMNWDPITRIVGSLGIFTKIDFANRQVAECYSTSSIFRGYSIFMQGKILATPPSLPAYLRHLRRQSRHLRRLRVEHGFRHGHPGIGRLYYEPRRGRRIYVRP